MATPKATELNYSYNGNSVFALSVNHVDSADYVWQKCMARTTNWINVSITSSNVIHLSVNPETDIGCKYRCLIKVNEVVTQYSKSLLISRDKFVEHNRTNYQYAYGNYQYNQKQYYNGRSTHSVSDTDGMDGHQFEYYCADILRKNGYTNVVVTQSSGDYGVDITAAKDSITYAIQCKCYTGQVGNDAVQEVYSGKAKYKCTVAVVLTNSYFTKAAKETAEFNSVILWDRDKLDQLIKDAYSTRDNRTEQKKEQQNQRQEKTNSTQNTMPSFFKGCENWEQVKERYRNLMKTYHPDSRSGDIETSQVINSQYEELKKKYGQ